MAVHVIGLTGGIASGKTTVAKLLAGRGAAVIDADLLARQVVEPGQPALAELVARFGAAILTTDGRLDRKRLAAIAFADPAARADLGRITHPRIAAASAAAIATWADAGANIVFYEAALLVENRAHAGLAGLIVVAAPEDVQYARLVERDRMSPEEARARIAAQAPLADKLAAATWMIENTGELDALDREVARVAGDIEARFGQIRVPRVPGPARAETEGNRSIAGKGPRDSLARGNPVGETEGNRSIAGKGPRDSLARGNPVGETEGNRSIAGKGPRDSLARGNPVGETEGNRSIAGKGPRDSLARGNPVGDTATGRTSRLARPATLITGFPAFTAKRMIGQILAAEPETKLYVLARDKFSADADSFLASLPDHSQAEVLAGDVCDMDLGLSSAEYRALSRELSWIHHLAGIYFMGADEDTARRVNVVGTRTVIDLARDTGRLERVVHWSTVMVSGDRKGTFYEDDLEAGQRFRNAYERTKYEAERLVRAAMRQLPITVVRPGIIVGDSRTGEIDKLDGPYYLMVLIATNASRVRLPLLGRSNAPLHLVPIDYVVEAAWHVARGEAAAGKTFHLVDPAPLSARAVFESVAEHAHTEKPRGHIPRPLARAVLRTTGLSRLGRGPLALLDVLDHAVRYDQTTTAQALAGTGVRCPPLAEYLPVLVRYVLDVTRGALPDDIEDVSDPLDEP